MDQAGLKRPSSNQKWLWWGLGSFFALVIVFRLGAWSAGISSDGLGKKVGIVHINGPIVSAETTVKQLEKFRKRNDVPAIVVRIDSPGGLVAPTQEIYEKIKAVRAEKPVVSSMGTVAASGGYYIAVAADSLMANPGTIVGSIGVVVNYPVMTELMNKVGIEFETVKSGELKDVGSYSREVTEADRAHLNEMVSGMYDQFVAAVADGRYMSKEDIVSLADGRVFTGLRSKELGLIDALGTFEDAVVMAGSMGQISGKPKTVQVRKKRPSLLDWFSGNLGQTVSSWFDELPAYRWRME
ncbi:MAG: signal peptide peptidase SppA [Candidatus Marinimicrobia bacterium]|jgi:protease-4|nr:signal peptide peptidase SppA [Candidatus Neomarinimicrobiota bacterium]MDP6610916.1 signal peptide peptidase SppA [Candidatus Neomarinimicrobiota bacterium]|tara:strand:+ start:30019 stop:30909 length:891 start_codon:yes stop_codon:yes gene_type:complete